MNQLYQYPLKCDLCPRQCRVNRNIEELGYCKSNNQVKVSRYSLHFWEEPPISGESGSGTVFFSQCSLRCCYCQNYEIVDRKIGNYYSAEQLSEIYKELKDRGALNINLVTPTHFAPTIRQSIQIAKDHGINLPFIWNTSGYELDSQIKNNAGFIDIYLSDFKYQDATLAKDLSSAPDYFEVALSSLKEMVKQIGNPEFDIYRDQTRLKKGVVVRHLLLPGQLENSKSVLKTLHENFGDSILISIMNQYTPVLHKRNNPHLITKKYENLNKTISTQDYEEVLDFADRIGISDYYWQSGDTAKESFIPDFD